MARHSNLALLAALCSIVVVCHGAPINDGSFRTCSEALAKIPGYDYTTRALAQCPDLQKMQSDPSLVKTFFVPSNTAIQAICDYIGLPLEKILNGDLKALMCQILKYHIVNSKVTLDQWSVGQGLTTSYFNAKLTVKATGNVPEVKTQLGSAAKVERVALCGSAVAYGIDAVLAPFPVPRLG